jgi:hypothetical protein
MERLIGILVVYCIVVLDFFIEVIYRQVIWGEKAYYYYYEGQGGYPIHKVLSRFSSNY